jgi:hypothetical protein
MFRPGNPRRRTGDGTEAGQPRPSEDTRGPSAAERVRTLMESSVSARLVIPDGAPEGTGLPGSGPPARAVTPEGDVILLVEAGDTAARAALHSRDADLPAVMEITDVPRSRFRTGCAAGPGSRDG